MSKVAIMSDSNCGITPAEAQQMGIEILPMPIIIDGHEYFEDVTITHEEFYKKLIGGSHISTSQPSPGSLMDKWEGLLRENDEVVYIPMSSGLSKSFESANMFAFQYNGRVKVVDNHRISVTQRLAVMRAKQLADKGLSAEDINNALTDEAFKSMIFITCDDLQYLKRGGRLTPAVAAIGTLLNIKPVLKIDGYRLDAFMKTRGMKAARKGMINAALEYAAGMDIPLSDERVHIGIAYTDVPEETLNDWIDQVTEAFPGKQPVIDPLSLVIACHTGPGALGITVSV